MRVKVITRSEEVAGAPATTPRDIPVARPRLPRAEAILPYLNRIDETRWYSNFGPLVTAFEARLAARLGAEALVCTVANGTQALTLALQAMQIAPGTLCAMPSWTFVATPHAAIQAGLIPWLLDVDASTWMLDPNTVEAALAQAPGQVGAVIPVAAFGAPLDLAAWEAFQARTGVRVLIDAAAAFDSLADTRLPACVSLHATKTLGIGEGGFFATSDPILFDRFRRLTSFGFRGSRESAFPATNAKLSEYGAAVGLAALDSWPGERLRYLRAGQMMRMALSACPEVSFQPGWGFEWVSSTCVVTLPGGAADAVEQRLAACAIETRRWWGEGCHHSAAFGDCPKDALPVTERLAASTLGLPFAVDLDRHAIGEIATALSAAFA